IEPWNFIQNLGDAIFIPAGRRDDAFRLPLHLRFPDAAK
nr:hypothetical protein [Tanacetum cinerariifolium]